MRQLADLAGDVYKRQHPGYAGLREEALISLITYITLSVLPRSTSQQQGVYGVGS